MKMLRKRAVPLVENTFNIMKYLYKELNGRKFKNIDISEIHDIVNLYAVIISTWASCIATEGMYKEYKEYEERMSQPTGSINLQESITQLTMLTGELICNYEELTEDTTINQLLKATLQYLYYDDNTEVATKSTILKTLQQFSQVTDTPLDYTRFNKLRFNNNNIRYKNLLEMCATIANKKQSEAKGIKLSDVSYTYKLFKKQIYNYYLATYSDKVSVGMFARSFQEFDTTEMQYDNTDKLVVIQTDSRALVIMVRLVDISAKDAFDNEKQLLDTIVHHIQDYTQGSSMKIAGTLMYVNSNENNLDMNQMKIETVQNVSVGKQIVNIYDVWKFITFRLDEPYKSFIARYSK